PRRTDFGIDEGDMDIEDLVANESQIITISHLGYIKRTQAEEFRTQARGGKGLKGMETREAGPDESEDDFVEHLFTAETHDYLLFFTNTGRVFVERVFYIPEGGRTSKGRSIKNLLNVRPEEKIAATLRIQGDPQGDKTKTFTEAAHIVFATRSGIVKKTNLSDFRNIRKDGIIAISIEDENELIGVSLTDGSDEIVLITHKGLSLRCDEGQFRDQGRGTRGVSGIRPGGEDFVVAMSKVDAEANLLVVSENGIGKRTPFEDYRLQNRGGKGIITMKTTEKTGLVIGALAISEDDELMLMTSKGQSVRIRAEEVRQTGRNAQGVKLMSLGLGETIQDIARVIPEGPEDEEEGGEEASATAADGDSPAEGEG
ncbi:MAG: DNA gyrase C-terminal beta-propeller domain-containing protein, partial [Verrucomicrobiota bacterium]